MFRKLRKSRQQLPEEEVNAILAGNTLCTVACDGDDGYPYSVPVNYVYDKGCIYFHCACEGHKTDAFRRNPKVSFCITDMEKNAPEKFTTLYKSVIAFGKASFVEDAEEKRHAIDLICDKFSSGVPGRDEIIRREWNALCIVKITIEHISGKQASRLVK